MMPATTGLALALLAVIAVSCSSDDEPLLSANVIPLNKII